MTSNTDQRSGVVGPPEPGEFLSLVANAEPGWSARFGGPEGVARLAVELQEQINQQQAEIAAVRTAAIRELLIEHSLASLALRLGVSKQAISKIRRGNAWRNPTW